MHRTDDIAAPTALPLIGNTDVDRYTIGERSSHLRREYVALLVVDRVEHDHEVDVAVRAIVTTRHRSIEDDPRRIEPPDEFIDDLGDPFNKRARVERSHPTKGIGARRKLGDHPFESAEGTEAFRVGESGGFARRGAGA